MHTPTVRQCQNIKIIATLRRKKKDLRGAKRKKEFEIYVVFSLEGD